MRRRYTGYRGRNGVKNIWGIVLCGVVVLLVLLVLVLLIGQRYVYYGGNGVHLDLPFENSEQTPPPDVSKVVVEVLPPAEQEPEISQQEEAEAPEAAVSVDGAEGLTVEEPTE